MRLGVEAGELRKTCAIAPTLPQRAGIVGAISPLGLGQVSADVPRAVVASSIALLPTLPQDNVDSQAPTPRSQGRIPGNQPPLVSPRHVTAPRKVWKNANLHQDVMA